MDQDKIRFGSVCSGIEAASVAWEPLGWEAQWFSEIEQFPSAVLAHRFPSVPNLGDMTKIHETQIFQDATINLLVGGTPCQSFSVAGLRKGLTDPRGNLMLTFLSLAQRKKPRWIVWENVPGVLSSNGGRDFGTFLQALAELGYGFAYRVLDAQYFGVAQRRRRVFVVGYLGDWRPAGAVLFEQDCLSGNSKKGREKRKTTSEDAQGGSGGGGEQIATFAGNIESDTAATLQTTCDDYSRADDIRATTAVVQPQAIDFRNQSVSNDVTSTLQSKSNGGYSLNYQPGILQPTMAIRRLTPTECERLQGFPDGWTKIPYRNKPEEVCPDGPRYKACGNSMAVPVMRWIGQRIEMVEQLMKDIK